MNPLDIYSQVESSLGFDDEIARLHNYYIDEIVSSKATSLLDIGCGRGDILAKINQTNPNIKTLGIDLSSSQIKICQNRDIEAICTSLQNLPKTKKFDIIIAVFDVLNYIPKDELKQFFEDIKIRLNDGGKFIFDVNSKFGFEEVAQGSIIVKDEDDEFIGIDAIYEDDILYTSINHFIKEDKCYKRENGTIKQYYHSSDIIKKYSKMRLKKIDFHLHTDSDDEYAMSDKYIYVLE
jgi:SAM-dependent methyltransferase